MTDTTAPVADGGPAFPHDDQPEFYNGVLVRTVLAKPGMSLRDFFAAHALTAACTEEKPWLGEDRERATAKLAYRIADSMLAARTTQTQNKG